MSEFNSLLERLSAKSPDYHDDRTRLVFSEFPKLDGYAVDVVALGGYRLNIYHVGQDLVGIFPKAMSAGRGHFVLALKGGSWTTPILGRSYDYDPCGGRRLAEALDLAKEAWESSGGDLDRFFVAIGRSGHCAICGATLTDDLSMARGIGPECIKKIGVGKSAVKAVQKRRLSK